ncbi:MAG: PAS domain S-box protein, partial [Thermodesulfobacteriota bacterium]
MNTEAIYPVLALAVCLQFGAAFMAWRLIRVTGTHVAWLFIAGGLLFMAIRRCMSFLWFVEAQHAGLPAVTEEITAFATSLLMFAGVAAIRPLFERMRDSRDLLAEEVRERTEAEDRLRRSEQRYRSLFENSRDAICILRRDGRFIDLNPALSSLFDCPRPEIMAMKVADFFETPHDLTRLHAGLEGNGFVKDQECQMRSRRGITKTCLITSSAHAAVDGTVQYYTMFRDVTERRQAALTIKMEKQKFESLAENAPFGLLMVDQDGAFRYVNRKFRELFGYEHEDIPRGREWLRKAFPDRAYRREVIQTWIKDLRGSQPGEQRPRIFRVQCRDQATKIVHFRPVQLPTNQHIVSCEDITQLKHTEEALVQSEQLLRTILSATPSAITYLKDGTIRWTNPAMLTMFGLASEEECLGKKAREFYGSQQEYERVLALFKKRVHSCAPLETEALFKRKDGVVFHGELKIKRLNGPTGGRELITSITDISERVKAQEELRASEEKYRHLYEESKRQYELYRSLLDSSADAVVVYDLDGFAKYVNDSFTEMFGWTLEDVRGRRIPYMPDSEREASMVFIRR